jgi:hypothetical protein
LPEDLAEGLFEVFIYLYVLVVAEEAVGQLGELGDVVVGVGIFPASREGEVGAVFGWGGGLGGGGWRG